jgi:DHA1 family inner membrane transport protein
MTQSDRTVYWPTYAALLLGNFVVGVGVLMPAGLLNELSQAFAQDPATTGLLIAYGAAVLCIEAPLLAIFTNRIDRRTLLTGALVVYALGHCASAFAPNFATLLIARLIMIGGAAAFTPQAASAIGLLVPPERRATAVASIFLGWPMASAVGVPLASFMILWILCATMIFIAGQFTVYPYIAVELKQAFDATPATISLLFAVYGVAGVVGSLISAIVIGKFGAAKTVSIHLGVVLAGLVLWAASGAVLAVAIAGLIAWGYGGGPAISGQQARLIMANTEAASASVALNTSVLYAGQASGAYLGGVLLSNGHLQWSGVAGATLVLIALSVSLAVRRWLHA